MNFSINNLFKNSPHKILILKILMNYGLNNYLFFIKFNFLKIIKNGKIPQYHLTAG